MYHRLFACLALILAILLSSTYVRAQQDKDTNAALRQKAFDLLESVAGQLSTLQSAENRARLGANIADSLWKHDERRARALLALVQQDINSALEIKERADQSEQHTFSEEHPGFGVDLSELIQNNTPDEILALAEKDPQRAEYITYGAVQRAQLDGDLVQARKIANRLPDSATRRYVLDQIDRAEKWAEIDDEKLTEVEARINSVENLQARVNFLLTVSHQFGANNPKAALKLLDRASGLIDAMKPGKEQTESQIALAMMYCFEKNDRGLSLMESLVPRLNELMDLAAKLDGYDTRYLRDGEWNMSANGATGELLTRLSQNAGHFAWCDFDRAVSLAGRFDRAEIRLMAQVKLAQGILAGPPKRVRTQIPIFR